MASMSKGWHVEAAERAAIPGTGGGVRVAVIDTGIAAHPAVASRVEESWVIEEGRSFQQRYLEDRDGHGTHVAGVIASVAPEARLLSIGLLDPEVEDFVAAFALAASRGALIANLSGGWRQKEERLIAAARQLWEAGVLLICAAGNEGEPAWRCPAGIAEVLTVGARRRDGSVAAFTGGRAEIWAPGVDVWSSESPAGYGYRSGTSQAAAVVSGLAARVLASERVIGPEQLKERLLRIEW